MLREVVLYYSFCRQTISCSFLLFIGMEQRNEFFDRVDDSEHLQLLVTDQITERPQAEFRAL